MKKNDGTDKAVALRYNREQDNAPKIMAKGRGTIAEKILSVARENNIPIKQDKALIDALYRLEINEEIPEDLYRVVAEILAFVYRMNQLKKNK